MLDHNKQSNRQSQRFQRRKASKSPINIRGKIKELEDKLQKNHKLKEAPKMLVSSQAHFSPKREHPKHHNQVKVSRQAELPYNQKISPKIDSQKNVKELDTHSKPINCRPTNQKLYSPNRLPTPPAKIERRHSETSKGRVRKELTQKTQDNLQQLREQNMRFREIYNRSVQKIQNLQQRLTEMRSQQQSQKNSLETTFQILQSRVQNRKRPLAHIYSYEQKNNNLIVIQEKIITETDNQNSSCQLDHEKKRKFSQSCSALSIESK